MLLPLQFHLPSDLILVRIFPFYKHSAFSANLYLFCNLRTCRLHHLTISYMVTAVCSSGDALSPYMVQQLLPDHAMPPSFLSSPFKHAFLLPVVFYSSLLLSLSDPLSICDEGWKLKRRGKKKKKKEERERRGERGKMKERRKEERRRKKMCVWMFACLRFTCLSCSFKWAGRRYSKKMKINR